MMAVGRIHDLMLAILLSATYVLYLRIPYLLEVVMFRRIFGENKENEENAVPEGTPAVPVGS